jgi:hypothetical protein
MHLSIDGLAVIEVAPADSSVLQFFLAGGNHPGLEVNAHDLRAKAAIAVARPLLYLFKNFAIR